MDRGTVGLYEPLRGRVYVSASGHNRAVVTEGADAALEFV
jgi:hypothetical protein